MNKWLSGCLACLAIVTIPVGSAGEPSPPGPDQVATARPAWRYEPERRCSDLRTAGGEAAALVVFRVSSGGIPSRATIKSSSRSESLDTAALACVMKLRFQPATNLGDGAFLDSWQQIALTWARQSELPGSTSGTAPRERPSDNGTPDASAKPPDSASQGRKVEVRVCVDEIGKLTQQPKIIHSSGDPGFDESAVKIAKAGSGNYRPTNPAGKKPAAGCVQLAIEAEAN